MENKLYNKIKEALSLTLEDSFLCTKCIESDSNNDFAKVTYTMINNEIKNRCAEIHHLLLEIMIRLKQIKEEF